MNHKLSVIPVCAALLLLCGCGSLFEREYISVETYAPAEAAVAAADSDEVVKVHTYAQLQQALQNIVYTGSSEGIITFDPDYAGDEAEDLASATWQLRTEDALCAYCVDNISYELTQIITHSEASVHVSYGSVGYDVEDIVSRMYFTDIDTLVQQTMENCENKLVFLISRSIYSDEDVREIVAQVYRKNPYVSPCEPQAGVNVYSGAGKQRLYEVNIDYGVDREQLLSDRRQIAQVDPFQEVDSGSCTQEELARIAYDYLAASCRLDEEAGSSAYDALVLRRANSEGIALGFAELCRREGIAAEIVYGQYMWNDACWNIVSIDGMLYHVDASHPEGNGDAGAENEGKLAPFLKSDSEMWNFYRWDTNQYPACGEFMPVISPEPEASELSPEALPEASAAEPDLP